VLGRGKCDHFNGNSAGEQVDSNKMGGVLGKGKCDHLNGNSTGEHVANYNVGQ
jgi:hypothetical protein